MLCHFVTRFPCWKMGSSEIFMTRSIQDCTSFSDECKIIKSDVGHNTGKHSPTFLPNFKSCVLWNQQWWMRQSVSTRSRIRSCFLEEDFGSVPYNALSSCFNEKPLQVVNMLISPSFTLYDTLTLDSNYTKVMDETIIKFANTRIQQNMTFFSNSKFLFQTFSRQQGWETLWNYM